MISMIRLDDRLVHGQVAFSWKARLGYQAVVIASDSASKDEVRKMALKMCCPEDVKIAIRDVDNAIELLKNEKLKPLKVLVVTDNTEDLLKLCSNLDEKPLVNIGGLGKKDDTKELFKAVWVNERDIENLNSIQDLGYKIEAQQVPSSRALTYKK